MRRLTVLIALLVMWILPTAAQQQQDARIEAVITQQLDAFNGNDGPGAFKHASPFIQGMFGDPSTFVGMVQSGYPQIHRSRSAKFLKLSEIDGRLTQTVLIEGADGSIITAAYEMIEIDGVWRINGVRLARSGEV
jgi:hypothetical protein